MITSDISKRMQTDAEGPEANSLLERLPVLGICGSSGAGKTTLIEAVVPLLLARGIRVAVVKHDARHVRVDRPGKDSDRFYRAGADVWLSGEGLFGRRHRNPGVKMLLAGLCRDYDLVLVEGHAGTPVAKLWLLGEGHSEPLPGPGSILHVLPWRQAETKAVLAWITAWLDRQWCAAPVWGCVLIGGRSRRMGRPKHLLRQEGRTWLEGLVAKLREKVDRVVISGRGEIPASLVDVPCIPDAPGLAGPLAGVLSVLRWQPYVSWLVTACDQPCLQPEALDWLLAGRSPGVRAILPDLRGDGRPEPLLAYYDFRCRDDLEDIAASGRLRLGSLSGRPAVLLPRPPAHLHQSWRNINLPAEIPLKLPGF